MTGILVVVGAVAIAGLVIVSRRRSPPVVLRWEVGRRQWVAVRRVRPWW